MDKKTNEDIAESTCQEGFIFSCGDAEGVPSAVAIGDVDAPGADNEAGNGTGNDDEDDKEEEEE